MFLCRPILFCWQGIAIVGGFLMVPPPALRRRFLYRPLCSNPGNIGGGGQEGFHYLSTDVPEEHRNSLAGVGPHGLSPYDLQPSRFLLEAQAEAKMDYILNNHSEAAQIKAAQEAQSEGMQSSHSEAFPKLTPPLLGPPPNAPLTQQATETTAEQEPQRTERDSSHPMPDQAMYSQQKGEPVRAPREPITKVSWTPTTTQQPLWWDLQSEPQRNAQLQAELRKSYIELRESHGMLQTYQEELNMYAGDLDKTKEELEQSQAKVKESEETIFLLRKQIESLQREVHAAKSVELDHAKENHKRELEIVRQQGYESAVSKVKHWSQRITKLENEMKMIQSRIGGTDPPPTNPSAANGSQAAPPQLPPTQGLPWSTMPGATFGNNSVYDVTATTTYL